jgi:hypothetical protein
VSTSPFAALLGLQRSEEQRVALQQLRDDLGLRQDDALWRFVALIEEHFAAAQPRVTSKPVEEPVLLAILPRWFWLLGGMAAQTLFGAVCLTLGAHAARAGALCWAPDRAGASWIQLALSLPAGWMAFLFALPLAAFVVHLGWRLRAAGERAWGSAVMICAAGGFAASGLALWRLL